MDWAATTQTKLTLMANPMESNLFTYPSIRLYAKEAFTNQLISQK